MRKTISLFQRNYETDRLVRDEVVPGAEWVLAGEGVATQKFDGVCTMVRDGKLFKRYEARAEQIVAGKLPANWEPADEMDTLTQKQMGWVPVGDGPEDRYMREAFENTLRDYDGDPIPDGTYEFLGPKAQGNVEGMGEHFLMPHGMVRLDAPRDYASVKAYLESRPEIEGIVWHHEDGRMVKIKGKDFGIKRIRPTAKVTIG